MFSRDQNFQIDTPLHSLILYAMLSQFLSSVFRFRILTLRIALLYHLIVIEQLVYRGRINRYLMTLTQQ